MREENRKNSALRRVVSATLSAALIAILGVGAITMETAQAAGVMVEHRTYGAPAPAPPPRDEEDQT